MLRVLIMFPIMFLVGTASAETALEAVGSCIVIHENSESDGEKTTTCFENISLERSSFESGVCLWKTEEQAAQSVQTTTKFVPYCPASYAAYCDRLVLGPGIVAPVKIFLYDKSEQVLARAKNQCVGGGGKWITNHEEAD